MEVNPWVRAGECSNCGHCCENLGRFAITLTNHDLEYIKMRGGPVVEGDFHAPCPQHVNNQCKVYSTRPRTCSDFPSTPNEIIRTPCSYWFEREVDGVLERQGGKGSPWPIS